MKYAVDLLVHLHVWHNTVAQSSTKPMKILIIVRVIVVQMHVQEADVVTTDNIVLGISGNMDRDTAKFICQCVVPIVIPLVVK